MTDADTGLREVLAAVALDRQRGDARRRRQGDAAAAADYRRAVQRIDAFLATDPQLQPADMAELHGVRGGLLRRLGELAEALESYQRGAAFEQRGRLASTYNRLNAIRHALLIGDRSLDDLRPEIAEVANVLDRRLRDDPVAADDAWLWADLGDVQLLRGEIADARDAYHVFTRRATSRSPATTLDMLDQLVEALERHDDPAAPEVRAAVDRLRPLMSRDDDRAPGPPSR